MSRPTSYDLLLEVQKAVNRLEDKFDGRMDEMEKDVCQRLKVLESWKENMMGKISIIGAIAGGVMGVIFSAVSAFINKR